MAARNFVLIGLAVLTLSACGGNDSPSPPPVETKTAENPAADPAADLAAISNDVGLIGIKVQLDQLSGECPRYTRRELVDYTLDALDQLEAAGLPDTPFGILVQVSASIVLGQVSNCPDAFANYVALRKSGG